MDEVILKDLGISITPPDDNTVFDAWMEPGEELPF